jgi:protocatechuate 3,4-dioxygenase beta subunit
VTAASTGRPVPRAEIRVDGPRLPVTEPRVTVSDENGRYEIGGLATGRYTVSASKVGFLTTSYGQSRAGTGARPVDVRTGGITAAIDVALQRAGVITAVVVDRTGAPVAGMMVRAFVSRFVDGVRQLQPVIVALPNVTDDRGAVRIHGLPPGEFYLVAKPEGIRPGSARYVQTLYPGTTAIAGAQPVRLGSGEELTVTWTMMQSRHVRLIGTILDATGAPVSNPAVQLRTDELGAFSTVDVSTAADGTFKVDDLAAGDYLIIVRPLGINHRILVEQDVTSVMITAKRQTRLHGRIVLDVPGQLPQIPAFTFRPVPPQPSLSGMPNTTRLPVNADGSFDTTAAFGVGVLQLTRTPATAGWFLKSMVIEGREVSSGPLDFGSLDGKQVEIVLTRRRGTMTGTIVDRRANPVVDASVVVFPAETADWTPFTDRIATARPDQNGRFEIDGLPPGRYLAAVVDSLEPGDERNPEALERLRDSATALTLADGETRAMNLRLDR